MSVTNGQLANQTNFNAAFMSRTASTTSTTAQTTFSNGTQSTDKDTGGVILDGGLGVEKNINAGGTIKNADTTQSTNKDTGAIVTEGGLGVEKNANIGGNASVGGLLTTDTLSVSNGAAVGGNFVVGGDLTVNGTQTILNTSVLEVKDQNIIVNNNGDNTSAQGAGITVERTGTSGSIAYDSTLTSRWKAGDLGAESEVIVAGGIQTVTGNKTISGIVNMSSLSASYPLGLDSSKNIISYAPSLSGTRASPTLITALGGISFSGVNPNNYYFIQGSGGPITITANPQISAGSYVGQELTLNGRDDTNTVTISDGTGLDLNGPYTLGAGSVWRGYWDGTNWKEISRGY